MITPRQFFNISAWNCILMLIAIPVIHASNLVVATIAILAVMVFNIYYIIRTWTYINRKP